MLTDMQADHAWVSVPADSPGQGQLRGTSAFRHEPRWRRPDRSVEAAGEDITISRWRDLRNTSRQAEATTPSDRYFVGVALKTTRLKLTRGRQIIFDGVMPAGTLYVGAPSKPLSAQFDAPCDFLHFHISVCHFGSAHPQTAVPPAHDLNDLVLLRDTFAGELAKALIEHGDTADATFARCIGQTLAMHLARLEFPRAKVNPLPKWRLRRVEDYIREHFGRSISLSDLAKVAGLSRMHFAAQFRAATGYRPREYLLHQRIDHAKSLLATTGTSLAEIALAVGFCTQAHFSTVFKRITGDTPARWRCVSRNQSLSSQTPSCRATAVARDRESRRAGGQA